MPVMGDVAATFCATLADEWARCGVTDVVAAPGSRSTPLVVAVARCPELRLHVMVDERSAGFCALGLGVATGRPAVVITTSGTAAVELHPAVVEAHHAGVPLICATADRPAELQGVGAPQTVDQVGLYGAAVRWAAAPGAPVTAASSTWRSLAARSVAEATGGSGRLAGPVHLNLGFREPLLGEPGGLPSPRGGGEPWHRRVAPTPRLDDDAVAELAALVDRPDVVVAAGAGAVTGRDGAEAVHQLVEARGWPLLADPRSGVRLERPCTVAYFDALLRAEAFAEEFRPSVVLRLGRLPASKVLGQWLAAGDATEVVVDPTGAWIDPDHRAAWMIVADPADVCRQLHASPRKPPVRSGERFGRGWVDAEHRARAAVAGWLAGQGVPTEPGVARAALAAVPPDGTLVVASSMPVRDVEWFTDPSPARVVANRGANGIDGVTSTAVGVALGSGRPTVAVLGDLAFVHDTNGLAGLSDRDVDLTLVVVDNEGGGIFSFLPQASALPREEFERLFGTPSGANLAALARAHGLDVTQPETADAVDAAIAESVAKGGARVVLVRTDRKANVAVHDELGAAVATAISSGTEGTAPA